MITDNQIKRYMNYVMDHGEVIDPITGEVNLTELAELTCFHFNDYDGDDIPEKYFELAFEVGE